MTIAAGQDPRAVKLHALLAARNAALSVYDHTVGPENDLAGYTVTESEQRASDYVRVLRGEVLDKVVWPRTWPGRVAALIARRGRKHG